MLSALRLSGGVLAALVAVLAAGAGGIWAYGKAFGTEWDVCPGGECYSGWFAVATLALLALALGRAAWLLLVRRAR